jgi:rod shape-determining protein MreC
MAVYRRASRRRYVLLLIVLTAVTLITLDSRRDDGGTLGPVGRVAHTIVSPVEKAVDAVAEPIGDWFDGVTEGQSLRRENERLRRRMDEMEDEQRQARAALEENKTFREILDLDILDEVPRVTARVVNRSTGNFEWTVTLDKGQESGISKNMPVLGPQGLAGRVLDSWEGGSKILLLIDPNSGVGVRVLPSNVTGAARGRAGSDLLTVDLDVREGVAVGDEVVTSGLENSTFPEGLSVGTVTEVEGQAVGQGMTVRVRPWVDFDALEYVTVLRWVPGQGPVVPSTTTPTTVGGAASTTTTLPPESGATSPTTGAG